MNDAALVRGLPIQLCMTLPSDLMQSLEMDAVTNYRASGDYAGLANFDIGGSSLLAWALGLRPSKDNFWTARPPSQVESGLPWPVSSNPGSNCELNAVIATLSTGPFGIADAAGTTNRTIVHAGTRQDGLILQPDRPATFIEAMFDGASAPGGHVWATHTRAKLYLSAGPPSGGGSDTGGGGNGRPATASSTTAPMSSMTTTQHLVLSIDVVTPYRLTSTDLYPAMSAASGWVAHRWGSLCAAGALAVASGCVAAVASEATMPVLHTGPPSKAAVKNDTHTFALHQLAPIFPNGWVLLGDLTRYAAASARRIPAVGLTGAPAHAAPAPQSEVPGAAVGGLGGATAARQSGMNRGPGGVGSGGVGGGLVVQVVGVPGEALGITALRPHAGPTAAAQPREWAVVTKQVSFAAGCPRGPLPGQPEPACAMQLAFA